MTDRTFERANDESRARLTELAHSLAPEQLATDLGSGWTVASALAHAGFWDRWQAERWSQILAGKWSADDESVITAEHLANEALHPYWAGIEAEFVPALAVAAATRVDALIAAAPDALIDRINGTAAEYIVHRYRHRTDHLDQIERALFASREGVDSGSRDAALRTYVDRNDASRARLAALVAGFTAEDLSRASAPSEEGSWTVGQILGHTAFWDRFLSSRWRVAQAAGPSGCPSALPDDLATLLNGGLVPFLAAFADGAAEALIAEVLAAAEEIDALVAGLPDQVPVGQVLGERPSLLDRSMHRNQHMGQIEEVLGR
jgi:hypothetical protein